MHPLAQQFFDSCDGKDDLDFFRYGKYRHFTDGIGIGFDDLSLFEAELKSFFRARGISHPREMTIELCSEFLEGSDLIYHKKEFWKPRG